ncbi:hypothetical protein D0C36_06910 [Mucilaginibacter conchicola]|uniref:Sensor of ECF-type sigma factor n=1 Tax=Mucilaginibacter conchicola TaxID=2303333 RepID=A0A372NZC4_9SPHI|nr:hypothetical protein [Mucilaginibacter conchicola]RFZ95251.1 hypothetical protein D0C36_06910 [Mucilaginibacter conchicola]
MTKLFKYIFITVLAVAGVDAFAQVSNLRAGFRSQAAPNARFNAPRTAKGKKILEARNNFISQQLNLTDDEAHKFWPLYNQYQQDLTAIRLLKRANNSNKSANGTEQVDKEIAYDKQTVEIRQHYRDEFMKILPAEKVSLLYKSEVEFKDELIKQLSERSIRAGN